MKKTPLGSDDLDQLLRSVPREKTSAEFTGRVLRRLVSYRQADPPRPFAWPRLAVASTVVAVVLLSMGLWQVDRQKQATRDEALLRELRAEYSTIASELEDLRTTDARLPVIYLGGSEQVDYVLDLEQLRKRGSQDQVHPTAQYGTQTKNY